MLLGKSHGPTRSPPAFQSLGSILLLPWRRHLIASLSTSLQ